MNKFCVDFKGCRVKKIIGYDNICGVVGGEWLKSWGGVIWSGCI